MWLLQHLTDALEYNERYKRSPFARNARAHKKHFEKLLVQGANPNPESKDGYSVLSIAVYYTDDAYFEMLLVYGATPSAEELKKIYDSATSAENQAMAGNFKRKYELVCNHFSRQTAFKPIMTKASNFYTRNGQIYSYFNFSDGDGICSNIKFNHDLTKFEEKKIIKLFTDRFYLPNDTDGEKICKSALDEMYHNKRLIEILRNEKGDIIGVSIYEIMRDDVNKNYYFYVSLGILDKKYAEKQIMRLIMFRMAYALKAILPNEYNVGILFLAIVHNSGLAFQQFPHYPKYQPDNLNALVKDLVYEVAGKNCGYTHDVMACYIQGQILSKGINPEIIHGNLHKEHFYKMQLGNPGQTTQGRAMPGFVFVSNSDLEYLTEFYASKGINVEEHIQQLAKPLGNFLSDILPEKHIETPKEICKIFPKTGISFWQPRLKKPILQTIPYEESRTYDKEKTLFVAKL